MHIIRAAFLIALLFSDYRQFPANRSKFGEAETLTLIRFICYCRNELEPINHILQISNISRYLFPNLVLKTHFFYQKKVYFIFTIMINMNICADHYSLNPIFTFLHVKRRTLALQSITLYIAPHIKSREPKTTRPNANNHAVQY